MRDKVTRQCPQTTTFEEKGQPKGIRTEVPLAYQPNALPLGQTGSQRGNNNNREFIKRWNPGLELSVAVSKGGKDWNKTRRGRNRRGRHEIGSIPDGRQTVASYILT